jgi:CHAP domain-containing protein
MSVATALNRVSEIETALAPKATEPSSAEAASGSRFAQVLSQSPGSEASVAGLRAVAIAGGEIGQAEQPPGSNDSARIAQYRAAVAGAGIGPWCADFVSWAAREAGAPLGDNGEGFQSVSAIWSWAEGSGRAIPADQGPPQPGDLIVWGGEHVGIVEAVLPDGSIRTIEGNSSDRVSQRTYGPDGGGATGYVRLG